MLMEWHLYVRKVFYIFLYVIGCLCNNYMYGLNLEKRAVLALLLYFQTLQYF